MYNYSPQLTWRDVQYITLMTARPIGDGEWVTNGVGRKGLFLQKSLWLEYVTSWEKRNVVAQSVER